MRTAVSCLMLLAILGHFSPVLPQNATSKAAASTSECRDRFIEADLNNDGVLSRAEIGNVTFAFPPSLANKDRVTRGEFLAACAKQ